RSAYAYLYPGYGDFNNTLSQTLQGVVKTHVVQAQARGYDSARHQALSNTFIPEKVYDQLVETVNRNLHLMHRYTELRKRLLGLDELRMYDVYVPKVKDIDFEMSY